MKIGLIARSEDRGLGNLTWEWAQHMRPERVLVVEPNHSIAQRPERYPGATRVRWDHHGTAELEEGVVREWIAGLDVIYSAETFYDWRICDWARTAGARTVCHVMPEYYRHGQTGEPLERPDAWWIPTRWRINQLPANATVVPVPIATERYAIRGTRNEEPVPRWLHIAGARAAADRNGTRTVLGALPYMLRDHEVRITSQDQLPRWRARERVKVTIGEPAAEYWDLYGDADALVLPRRYAGLSLPVLEAMGAGLAIVMTDVEPQRSEWPIIPVDGVMRGTIQTAAGHLRLAEVPVRTLAAKLDWLADHPDELAAAQRRSVTFAEQNSWANLEPVHRAELERIL